MSPHKSLQALPFCLVAFAVFIVPGFGGPLFKQDNIRVVFVGDSITGQGGGWINTGFVFQIEKALENIYPDQQRELISLGGSGSGVQSWLSHEKKSREEERFLDIKKFELKENLGKPADILVIMLGMNDVLAPYVGDDENSLKKWQADYLSLITALRARINPKTVALATISMATEDPKSAKNLLINRLNQLICDIAREQHFLVLPVNASVWDVLKRGRQINPRFHASNDFVHPNLAGHIGVATGMLKGLGETKAVAFLEDEPLAKVWQAEEKKKKENPAPSPATPWLLAAKLPQPFWDGNAFQADKARTPIDKAIEANADFTAAIDIGKGQHLVWQEYIPSINYTGKDQPGNADFSSITHASIFEGGYGAQWIKSPEATPVHINLSTDVFAGNIHLTLWLNGKQLHQGMLKKKASAATVKATLQKGWNTLVFKANHRAWQWQVVVAITSPEGKTVNKLEYSAKPQSPMNSTLPGTPTSPSASSL